MEANAFSPYGKYVCISETTIILARSNLTHLSDTNLYFNDIFIFLYFFTKRQIYIVNVLYIYSY